MFENRLAGRCAPIAVPLSWWCRRDLGDGSSERQGAQLSTEPSGPGVRWRLWPLLRQHCGEEDSFF